MIHSVEQIKRKIRVIKGLLPDAFFKDRSAGFAAIHSIKQSHPPSSDEKKIQALDRLEKKIRASVKQRNDRIKKRPKIVYDANLPIVAKKEEIVRAIKENQAVIISGATGSGKSTQLPKFCVEAGLGIEGMIGCTQPRRIAAISIASRIALEMGERVGGAVGHKIRFEDQTSDSTWVKIMTDGMLLAEPKATPTCRNMTSSLWMRPMNGA